MKSEIKRDAYTYNFKPVSNVPFELLGKIIRVYRYNKNSSDPYTPEKTITINIKWAERLQKKLLSEV